MRPRLKARRWAQFDMHHLLWEPALGPQRFFELYCETWRRSVLNLRGRKSVWQWLGQVDLRNTIFLMRALGRTQRMMDPAHYMAEYDLTTSDQSVAALRELSKPERRLTFRSGDSARPDAEHRRVDQCVGLHVGERHQLGVAAGKDIFIATSSSVVRSTHRSRRDKPSRICFRFRHHRHQVSARAVFPSRAAMVKWLRSSSGELSASLLSGFASERRCP
jgi:hypothetical protein